ncbi:MAG: Serine/threonine-protein kinase tel1 [Chaenotheca gracillima]|nr:MAG: Serine/threonine-protein kinase tel1 [Chaenotheca gracillima]
MSLNGLDNEKLDLAFQKALIEQNGWILLKYESRDEIAVLGAGDDGVPQVRRAIEEYPDQSPLYGFVRFRAKGVVFKYIPEGTSRLLQARVTVHFQAVIEKFSPHDVVYPVNKPSDLSDKLLVKACSLHSASGSIASSGSGNRQPLDEITEDAEEDRSTRGNEEQPRPSGAFAEERDRKSSTSQHGETSADKRLDDKEGEISEGLKSPTVREVLGRVNTAATVPTTQGVSRTSMDLDRITSSNDDRRRSFHSTRSTVRDPYSSYSYKPKPKVKLGPRPSLDTSGRPHTSGPGSTPRSDGPRPVSTLPAGLKIAPRKTDVSKRPRSQHGTRSELPATSPPPIPHLPQHPMTPRERPVTSSGPVGPKTPISVALPSPLPAMTPEKQRLMKALQLRKKQQSKPSQEPVETASVDADAPSKSLEPPPDSQESVQADRAATLTSLEQGSVPLKESENDGTNEMPVEKVESSPVSQADSSELGSTNASSFSVDKDRGPSVEAEAMTEVIRSQDDISAGDESRSQTERPHSQSDHSERRLSNQKHEAPHEIGEAEPEIFTVPHYTQTMDRPENSEDSTAPSPKQKQPEPNTQTENTSGPNVDQEPRKTRKIQGVADTEVSTSSRSTAKADSRPPSLDLKRETKQKKRRGLVEPIRTDISADNSEDLLSDDSLLDELNSATVEEAKPISVTRSPMTPVFPNSYQERPVTRVIRSHRAASESIDRIPGSNGGDSNRDSFRSVSGPFLEVRKNSSSPVAMIKKVNLSSGISQRIKALERFSSQRTSPVASGTPSPTPASSPFPPPRNASLRAVPARAASVSQPTPSSYDKASPRTPPKSAPMQIAQETKAEPARHQHHANGRPESISVKAQIVRDINPPFLKTRSVSEPNDVSVLDLHQSPLTIDHQRGSSSVTRNQKAMSKVQSMELPRSPRPSSTYSTRSDVTTKTEKPSKSRRLSSRRSRADVKSPTSPTSSNSSVVAEGDEKKGPKKESSRTRLLRRMSSISSASRKSIINAISPTVKEEEPIAEVKPVAPSRRMSVDMGEVNVQFPDNLLWKRRCIKVDSQGHILLTQSKSDEVSSTSLDYLILATPTLPRLTEVFPSSDREVSSGAIPCPISHSRLPLTMTDKNCHIASSLTHGMVARSSAHARMQRVRLMSCNSYEKLTKLGYRDDHEAGSSSGPQNVHIILIPHVSFKDIILRFRDTVVYQRNRG